MPISVAPIVEDVEGATDLEGYIEKIVMKMHEDAQGFLHSLLPVIMRISIFIVNIDTTYAVRDKPDKWITINDYKSGYEENKFEQSDHLNFHSQTIYVLRKDGHYDALYKPDNIEEFERLINSD